MTKRNIIVPSALMMLAGIFLAGALSLAQQASTGGTSQQSAKATKKPVQSTGIPPGADVEELAYVVLMNATNDQDKDLQLIQSEVQQAEKTQGLAKLQQARVHGLTVYNPGKPPKKSAKRTGSAAPSQKSSGVKQSH